MGYAENTDVPASRSREDIHRLLEVRKAQRIAIGQEAGAAIVFFQIDGKAISFRMPLPARDDKRFTHVNKWRERAAGQAEAMWDQACRSRWRGLLLTLKAKFVSVDNGVESMEEAFLAHLALPGGGTVGQKVLPMVAESYATNEPPRFLLGPGT